MFFHQNFVQKFDFSSLEIQKFRFRQARREQVHAPQRRGDADSHPRLVRFLKFSKSSYKKFKVDFCFDVFQYTFTFLIASKLSFNFENCICNREQYVHPRAREFFPTQEMLEDVLLQVGQNFQCGECFSEIYQNRSKIVTFFRFSSKFRFS